MESVGVRIRCKENVLYWWLVESHLSIYRFLSWILEKVVVYEHFPVNGVCEC